MKRAGGLFAYIWLQEFKAGPLFNLRAMLCAPKNTSTCARKKPAIADS